jgi:3-hydroxyisobutyrate dehydrogenase-like beta-hydroxyacid dehydrogenase
MSSQTTLSRIGFIGLGIMGSRMAANLAAAGFPLTVWNRTTATAERFVEQAPAARVAGSPAELARASDIVVTMVVDGDQVESVLLGPDGVADGGRPGLLCIDCSTIGPAATLGIAGRLESHQIHMVDAPVTGSAPRAADATLTIMAGGTAEDFALGQSPLEAMGRLVVHVGRLGQGQTIKLINNSVAAANALTVAEALGLGRAAGVDLDALVAVMEAGSGSSTMLSLKSRPMRSHDFTPLFKLAHMLKDVRLCLGTAEASQSSFPTAAAAEDALRRAEDLGYGEDDFAAIVAAVEDRSAREL